MKGKTKYFYTSTISYYLKLHEYYVKKKRGAKAPLFILSDKNFYFTTFSTEAKLGDITRMKYAPDARSGVEIAKVFNP